MRILRIEHPEEAKKIMRDIKVDPYGIRLMYPKVFNYLVRVNSISNITANILKQEMLSFGADAAIAKGALTGKVKKTDCLLIGSLSQFDRLFKKLKLQPFGLDQLAQDLSSTLKNYRKDSFIFSAGRFKLNLRMRSQIMGIVNLTPDSFSGDGLYKSRGYEPRTLNYIIDYVQKLIRNGADIIDFGGESSRPGAKEAPLKEELSRVIPVIKALSKKIKVPISIDTYKPEVARQALDNGASIINDITGLRNPGMLKVALQYKAGVIIMHMRGRPKTMQKSAVYKSLIDEITDYLNNAIDKAEDYGISREKIIIDPGIGFGKTAEHNFQIINSLSEFKVLGRPIMVGPSRKSFIGKILHARPQQRLAGTVSACVLAVKNGAKLVRVHDVKEVKEALKVADIINNK